MIIKQSTNVIYEKHLNVIGDFCEKINENIVYAPGNDEQTKQYF